MNHREAVAATESNVEAMFPFVERRARQAVRNPVAWWFAGILIRAVIRAVLEALGYSDPTNASRASRAAAMAAGVEGYREYEASFGARGYEARA